jgi:hypothetical protein
MLPYQEKKAATFAQSSPKSICKCGHTGDGSNSEHTEGEQGVAPGHGHCLVNRCKCSKFTWAKFTKTFVNYMGYMP